MRRTPLTAAVAAIFLTLQSSAQSRQPTTPVYLDPVKPTALRVYDLLGGMTREEKISQLVNDAQAIPRLNIPAYNWWSESLHGVLSDGSAGFSEPIGLGATFNPATIHEMAVYSPVCVFFFCSLVATENFAIA